MKELENWKRKHTPAKRVSKLEAFKTEIISLVSENYTHEQIKNYLLEMHSIETSRQNISKFVARQLKLNNTPSPKKKENNSEKSKMQEVLNKYST